MGRPSRKIQQHVYRTAAVIIDACVDVKRIEAYCPSNVPTDREMGQVLQAFAELVAELTARGMPRPAGREDDRR